MAEQMLQFADRTAFDRAEAAENHAVHGEKTAFAGVARRPR